MIMNNTSSLKIMDGLFVLSKKFVIICYRLETVFIKLGNGTLRLRGVTWSVFLLLGLLINLDFWCCGPDLSGVEIDKKLGFDPEYIPEPIKKEQTSYITLSITPLEEKVGDFCGILSREFLEGNNGKVKHVIVNSLDPDGKDKNRYYNYDEEYFIDYVSGGVCLYKEKVNVRILFDGQISMDAMFSKCDCLTSIEIVEVKFTGKGGIVGNMTNMFSGCVKLKKVGGLDNLNTNKVAKFDGMFDGCSELEEIVGWNKWKIGKNFTANGMFQGCLKLNDMESLKKKFGKDCV